jgi:CBS domain-containing protein
MTGKERTEETCLAERPLPGRKDVMLLKDVCTLDVICCSADTRVLAAAHLMRRHHVGDLVVVEDPDDERVPLGVVTDRDLVLDVLGNGLDPATTTLRSLVHRPVVIAGEQEDTTAVIERMRTHGVRRVPVVDGHGAVVGIITLNDLLRVFVDEAATLVQIMSRGENQERRTRR